MNVSECRPEKNIKKDAVAAICARLTGVVDGECLILLVGRDVDVELLLGLERGSVGQRLVADAVERLRTVRGGIAREDVLE